LLFWAEGGGVSADAQKEKLSTLLEWKVPKRLCGSPGHAWLYQGRTELAVSVVAPLVQHYKAWQDGKTDKQVHSLFLVLSGPGTGKSRMLDEMKGLLRTAAERSGNRELVSRMKKAYEFRVTFENGTSSLGPLLDEENPESDVSFRMLYQLAKDRTDWLLFAHELKQSYRELPVTIGMVVDILAKLEQIDDVKDMTVILCVDGLQKLENEDRSKTCAFYRVLTSICLFLNSSRAFAVCVCSATVHKPLEEALADSTQKRWFLLPPSLRGHEILSTRTRMEAQLVDDMGGHGRALEALQEVLNLHCGDSSEEVDPAAIVDEVYAALKHQYGDVFGFPLFHDPTNCQEVLAAVLSRRTYDVLEPIGHTGVTVDALRSYGLIRWTSEGRLECAFILLLALMKKLPKKVGEVDNFDEHITRSVLVWQRFEQFVAFYRRVKSIAFCGTSVALSDFHAGARFGSIDGIWIYEPHPRMVVEAVRQHDTKSISEDLPLFTNRDGGVKLSEMKTIVINGASASSGDVFTRVRLVGSQQVECNEVIQCKLFQTKQKMNNATYQKELAKGVKGDLDVFLLITSAQLSDDVALPPRCGVVSKDEFLEYFGPFASRAYRSLLEPPNINTASYRELRLIEGVGDATARSIIEEKKRGRFSSHEDAVTRLDLSKKRKIAAALGALLYDGEGQEVESQL
jgi:hypothetical protein